MNSRFWERWSDDFRANCAQWSRLPEPALPASGADWKKSATANPQLLQFREQTLLFYRGTGTAQSDTEERDQIAVGVVDEISHRGLQLAAGSEQLIVPSGGPNAFDADVLDPAAVEFRGELLLYYSALGSQGDSIGLASSADGVHFRREGRVMAGRAPSAVVREGAVYLLSQELLEGGGYALWLYRSADGRSFEPVRSSPVFLPDEGSWDSLSIVTARLYDDGDHVYMIYGGSADTIDEPAYFGLARSEDMIHWERHPGNPIFGAGARGSADGGCIWFPALAETKDAYALLYEGSVGTPRWGLDCSICMATVSK